MTTVVLSLIVAVVILAVGYCRLAHSELKAKFELEDVRHTLGARKGESALDAATRWMVKRSFTMSR